MSELIQFGGEKLTSHMLREVKVIQIISEIYYSTNTGKNDGFRYEAWKMSMLFLFNSTSSSQRLMPSSIITALVLQVWK